jgi:hypothetical protein
MKLYLASGWDNGHRVEVLADALESRGYRITRRWWEFPIGTSMTVNERIFTAKADMDGVLVADALVLWLPGDPPVYVSRGWGSHAEMGAAIARNIPVIIVEPDGRSPFCIFDHHPVVKNSIKYADERDIVSMLMDCLHG